MALRFFAVLTAVCLWPASGNAAPLALWATGTGTGVGAGLSALYTVDPSNGASTLVWNFPGIHIYAGGLAYDATTDTLYATGAEDSSTGTSRLFTIDRFTGATTSFAGIDSSINLSSGGLAIDPLTGVMYATGTNGHQSHALFTIDKTTGAATLVGQAGGECCVSPFGFNVNGLGFRSDGTLFANGFTLSQSEAAYSHLFTIDLTTGAATDIGSHGVTAGRQLAYSGLAFRDDGTLLSLGSITASRGGLYSVNPLTGAATLLGDTGVQFGVDGGLTFAPLAPAQTVPEPASLLLVGTGLALARRMRRRR